MAENNFELVKRELLSDPTQGAILARVLRDLSPEEIERLRSKAAEGKMAMELEQMSKVHQFQASSADIEQFIEQVKRLEFGQRSPFSTYKAAGEFKTATGTTTIQAKKGCFIATQVYGDIEHPNVAVLRSFRDEVLDRSAAGRAFSAGYHKIGPCIANSALGRGYSAKAIRRILDIACWLLKAVRISPL
jgi:uncharacterized protein (UPF0335 family)